MVQKEELFRRRVREARSKILCYILVVLVASFIYPVQFTHAADLTALSDNMSRLKNSSGSTVYANHTITFTLGGSTALNIGETIIVDFDNDFGVTGFATSDAKDYDIKVAGSDESIVANGGCASNDAIEITTIDGTEKTFTFTACGSYTAAAAGSTIEIEIGTHATYGAVTGDTQLSNPTASQVALVDLTAAGDTGKVAVEIISDDQIPVTATVNPTITFTVVNTALALGTLSSSSISTTGENNITIGTNGTGGYTIRIKGEGNGTNDGLYNAPASKLIASGTVTLSTGIEGYGGNCNKTSGDGTCSFADGATENVTDITRTDSTFASYGSKPSGTDTFRVRVKAAISTSTDAGSYGDTLTFVGTANF